MSGFLLRLVFVPTSQQWAQSHFEHMMDSIKPHVFIMNSQEVSFNLESYAHNGCHLIDLNRAISKSATINMTPLSGVSRSLQYILFTSGSTGSPKAVEGTERGILNRCEWMEERFPFSPEDVVAFTSATTFVDGIWQCFGPLLGGIRILIVPDAVLMQPTTFAEALAEGCVTHLVRTIMVVLIVLGFTCPCL